MLVYDRRVGAWYDDETGLWVDPPAEAEAPVSAGQALATLLLAPIVFVWVLDSYGIDVLAWLDRLGG